MSTEHCAYLLDYRTNTTSYRVIDAAIRLQQHLYRTIEYWIFLRRLLMANGKFGG